MTAALMSAACVWLRSKSKRRQNGGGIARAGLRVSPFLLLRRSVQQQLVDRHHVDVLHNGDELKGSGIAAIS